MSDWDIVTQGSCRILTGAGSETRLILPVAP